MEQAKRPCVAMAQPQGSLQPVVLAPKEVIEKQVETWTDQRRGLFSWKTLTSSTQTPTDTMTSGIVILPPGDGHLSVHCDKQAELYHLLQGQGIMKINGVEHAVQKGSHVFVPGNARHGIWNSSKTEELQFLYIFAVDDFAEVEYRFEADAKDGKDST